MLVLVPHPEAALSLDLVFFVAHHLKLSGLKVKDSENPDGDIEIVVMSLRPGEKLYEELLIDNESVKSSIKSIYQSLEKQINNKQFKRLYSQISRSYKSNSTEELKKILRNNFINYMPQNEK